MAWINVVRVSPIKGGWAVTHDGGKPSIYRTKHEALEEARRATADDKGVLVSRARSGKILAQESSPLVSRPLVRRRETGPRSVSAAKLRAAVRAFVLGEANKRKKRQERDVVGQGKRSSKKRKTA